MRGNIFIRILLAIILVVVVVSAGVWIYNAGVAQGLAAGAQGGEPPVEPGYRGYPYGGPYLRPWGFGFFPFGLLGGLLFFFLFFGLLRALFFRPWRGYGPGYWGGPHRPGNGPHDVPPEVEEWHRKMHAQAPETRQS